MKTFFSKSFLHDPVEKRLYKGNEAFFLHIPRAKVDKSKPLYYIYRNVRLPAHTALFQKQGLRFDITVLSAGKLSGGEAIRTIGHLHKKRGGKRPAEIYQVLSGSALFYLQHETKKEVRVIKGKRGAVVRITGAWAHCTINASLKKPLIIANIFTDRKNPSDYSLFRKTNGPAFFPVWKGTKIAYIPNPRMSGYAIRKSTAKKEKTLYTQFIEHPEKFRFLE